VSFAADQERAAVAALGDDALVRIHQELEARRPGATTSATGVRPRRRPWTYREIWRLEAASEEISRRGL
jgi:hypothetical protein